MLGRQFNFDIPVLMWEPHFTPETWDRLKQRHVPYGWRGLPYSGNSWDNNNGLYWETTCSDGGSEHFDLMALSLSQTHMSLFRKTSLDDSEVLLK